MFVGTYYIGQIIVLIFDILCVCLTGVNLTEGFCKTELNLIGRILSSICLIMLWPIILIFLVFNFAMVKLTN